MPTRSLPILRRATREPLVHFLALGALVYGLYAVTAPSPSTEGTDRNRITVTAGEVEWLATSWEKRWNRRPTPEEQDGLLRGYIRETAMYREALAMGLDRDDTIVRRRLAQKLEFLVNDLLQVEAPNEEVAAKVSMISLARGAVQAESWTAIPYTRFVELTKEI